MRREQDVLAAGPQSDLLRVPFVVPQAMPGEMEIAQHAPIQSAALVRREGRAKSLSQFHRLRPPAKTVAALYKKNPGFAAREIGRRDQAAYAPADDDRVIFVGGEPARAHRAVPVLRSAMMARAARLPDAPNRKGDAPDEPPARNNEAIGVRPSRHSAPRNGRESRI